jgi:hypothetical protein
MPAPTPEQFHAIWQTFLPLYGRLSLITGRRHGLYAHYTSVPTIEHILRTNEVWLSNPLFMNDLQELRAGAGLAFQKFPEAALRAGGDQARANTLIQMFNHYFTHFDANGAFDTYIFCLCEHSLPRDQDGILSMWREYGSKGNGAALVFNLEKVNFTVTSPLIIAQVKYASDDERATQLDDHLNAWVATTLALNLPDEHLHVAAFFAFNFIKLAALTTKHRGFAEEREIRIIYSPDQDPRGYLTPCLDYHVGPKGIEPKLKYKFGATYPPTGGVGSPDPVEPGVLTDLLEFILLGPALSSFLARRSFTRMLERNKLDAFSDRVRTSQIPLRPS